PAKTVAVGNAPAMPGVDASTRRVYVPLADDDAVAVLDGVTATVMARVPAPFHPEAVGVNPVSHRAYVAARFRALDPSGMPREWLKVWVLDGTPGSPTENSVTAEIIPAGREWGSV